MKPPFRTTVEPALEVCPSCQYDGGFHVLLRRIEGDKNLKLYLKCPGCKSVFDAGWVSDIRD